MSGASSVATPPAVWASMRDLLAQGIEPFAELFTASAPLPPGIAERLTDDATAMAAPFDHFATTPAGLDDASESVGERCLLLIELEPALEHARQAGERLPEGSAVVLEGPGPPCQRRAGGRGAAAPASLGLAH